MIKDSCIVQIVSMTDDGVITVVNGESRNTLIINVKNTDKQSSDICITKKEFNNIVKLINKHL